MDFQSFFIGIGLVLVSSLLYWKIKRSKSYYDSIGDADQSNYAGLLIGLMMAIIIGVVFIFKSFPA